MAARKSLLRSPKKLAVDRAVRAHACQHSADHRIKAGDKRLKVFTDPRSPDHYCCKCARDIIEGDIERLRSLKADLEF